MVECDILLRDASPRFVRNCRAIAVVDAGFEITLVRINYVTSLGSLLTVFRFNRLCIASWQLATFGYESPYPLPFCVSRLTLWPRCSESLSGITDSGLIAHSVRIEIIPCSPRRLIADSSCFFSCRSSATNSVGWYGMYGIPREYQMVSLVE